LDLIDPAVVEMSETRDSIRAENAKLKLSILLTAGKKNEAGDILAQTLQDISDPETAFGVLTQFVEDANSHVSSGNLAQNINEIEQLDRFLDLQSEHFIKNNPALEVQYLAQKCHMQANILQMTNKNAGGDPNRAAQSAKDALEIYSQLYAMLDDSPGSSTLPILLENLDDYVQVLLLNGKLKKAEAYLTNMLQAHSSMQALAKPMLSFVVVNGNWGNADKAREWLNYMLAYFPDAMETQVANQQFGNLLLRAQDKNYAAAISNSLSDSVANAPAGTSPAQAAPNNAAATARSAAALPDPGKQNHAHYTLLSKVLIGLAAASAVVILFCLIKAALRIKRAKQKTVLHSHADQP